MNEHQLLIKNHFYNLDKRLPKVFFAYKTDDNGKKHGNASNLKRMLLKTFPNKDYDELFKLEMGVTEFNEIEKSIKFELVKTNIYHINKDTPKFAISKYTFNYINSPMIEPYDIYMTLKEYKDNIFEPEIINTYFDLAFQLEEAKRK